MKELILITGATGFLGSRIARLLLENTNHRLAVLVRGKDSADAQRRLERAWSDWSGFDGDGDRNTLMVDRRVQVISGDLSLPRLGMSPSEYIALISGVSYIIHAAAELRLDGNLDEMRRINVAGTAALLDLARQIQADHGLKRFAHVSTAYVAGCRTGEVSENELGDAHGFSNAYEQTKFEGESLVRQAMADLPVSVFRPGMVVGDSQTGEIQTFNTVYVPLRLYLSGRLKLIPASPDMPLNMVPVDYVANSIVRLCFDHRAVGLTFHLTVAREHLPKVKELLDSTREWARANLGKAPTPARFIPLQEAAGNAIAARLGVPSALLSYFNEQRTYQRDNIDSLLGPYTPDWHAILPNLLAYAASKGFLRRTGRTVHEQLVHRLRSKGLPLSLHDLAADGSTRTRSGQEMCSEISAACRALGALGIAAGDRVALVGRNSSRYLSLDAAIGLAGAVSVPLYYTSPIDEIKTILKASGAKLLMVGDPALLTQLRKHELPVKIVSFCTDKAGTDHVEEAGTDHIEEACTDHAGRELCWEKFIEIGRSVPETPLAAPIGFQDLATIRYTSGTTGVPKGVTFRHSQLRWMAETVAAILPWEARTTPARYLSFLPMNHVVEGILGSYAPSCMAVAVDIYFLEDFHALPQVLPKVKPTVFFSVPRFYEKLWDRFVGSPAGRLYLALANHKAGHLVRHALNPMICRMVLGKSGLDRCIQLIAGSASFPDALLDNFRTIGIEIHNAYGLTEAPLITMNRYGANQIGSVGTVLPETRLKIAEDGEILVQGPQVSDSFFGESTANILDNGWLHTGDLGMVDREGRLVIKGRKKEILITSYGKNILPVKIEELLRRIPGMSEAMVIGDQRPSLSALLWLKDGIVTPEALKEIDRSVHRLNDRLSHPEQLKRWAIIADSPAIESGELTGNLKLRRNVVLARRADIVELLYDKDCDLPEGSPKDHIPGVVHIGGSRCA